MFAQVGLRIRVGSCTDMHYYSRGTCLKSLPRQCVQEGERQIMRDASEPFAADESPQAVAKAIERRRRAIEAPFSPTTHRG